MLTRGQPAVSLYFLFSALHLQQRQEVGSLVAGLRRCLGNSKERNIVCEVKDRAGSRLLKAAVDDLSAGRLHLRDWETLTQATCLGSDVVVTRQIFVLRHILTRPQQQGQERSREPQEQSGPIGSGQGSNISHLLYVGFPLNSSKGYFVVI